MAELSTEHKRANRLHLAIFDMQDTRRYLEAHAEPDKLTECFSSGLGDTVEESLIVAAIVGYCRPFTKNTSGGQALDRLAIEEFWWVTNNAAQKTLHFLVMTKRRKFVAHADWVARSTEIVSLTATGVQRTFSDPDVMDGLNPQAFHALAVAIEQDCFYQAMALQHWMHKDHGRSDKPQLAART